MERVVIRISTAKKRGGQFVYLYVLHYMTGNGIKIILIVKILFQLYICFTKVTSMVCVKPGLGLGLFEFMLFLQRQIN